VRLRPEGVRAARSGFLGGGKAGFVGVVGVMLVFFLLLLPAAPDAALAADVPTLSSTFTSRHAEESGGFGYAVKENNRYLVVASPAQTVHGEAAAGRVYVYSRSSGRLLHTLTSPNSQEEGVFGISIALRGEYLAVGALETLKHGKNKEEEAGQAYIFNASSGKLLRTFTSPNAEEGGVFGVEVDMSGNDLVVGAPREAVKKDKEAGHAYVFNAISGKLLQTLTSPNAQEEGEFGIAVAISGKKLAVGAKLEAVGKHSKAGRVYVYSTSSGKLLHTLTSPHPQEAGEFGVELGMSGEDLVVSAKFESVGKDADAGDAYVFNAGSGKLVHRIASPLAGQSRVFPSSIAVSGKYLVLGAARAASGGHELAGKAYVYAVSTGKRLYAVASPQPQEEGGFGGAVATSGKSLLVGANRETSHKQPGAGNAYLFRLPSAKKRPRHRSLGVLTVQAASFSAWSRHVATKVT
jgi:outer membrane protein assembly factor BamB